MSQANHHWQLARQIPTCRETALAVIRDVLAHLDEAQWPEEEQFSVHLALEEALMNAIKHGNREDTSKSIDVDIRGNTIDLEIRITDEGEGFDPSTVPDPTEDDNLEITTGRGLLLMRAYMNSIDFHNNGRTVLMKKQRQPS